MSLSSVTFQRTVLFSSEQSTQKRGASSLATAEQIHQTKEAFNSHFTSQTPKFQETLIETKNRGEIVSSSSSNYEVLFPVFAPEREGGKTQSRKGGREEEEKGHK